MRAFPFTSKVINSLNRHAWTVGLALVLVAVIAAQWQRRSHVQQLSQLPEWSVDAPLPSHQFTTGYESERRHLIVPEGNIDSTQWIIQSQRASANGSLRYRDVEYDNAPFGRLTSLPGIYRLFLSGFAWIDTLFSGDPIGIAIERAALHLDVFCNLSLLLCIVIFVTRESGALSGFVCGVAAACFYPLATNSIPGAPNHFAILPLLTAAALFLILLSPHRDSTRLRMRFFVAGVLLAGACWLNLASGLTAISGLIAGAIGRIFVLRQNPDKASVTLLPWRSWALGGALAMLIAYAAEYYPVAPFQRLDLIHPCWALTWLGLGELLSFIERSIVHRNRSPRTTVILTLASILTLLSVTPVAWMVMDHPNLLTHDLTANRLTAIDGGITKTSLFHWFNEAETTPQLWATLFPLLVIVLILPWSWFGTLSSSIRARLILASGPVVVTLFFAGFHLRWFSLLDATLLPLLALVIGLDSAQSMLLRTGKWLVIAITSISALFGLKLLQPLSAFDSEPSLTASELRQLTIRDFSHWLARRNPLAVVLAPPDLTQKLIYFGNLKGITTFDADNREGFLGAMRIASATSTREAHVLLNQRGITHIVLPNWDFGLDQSTQESSSGTQATFVEQLRDWRIPLWLRPVAYFSSQVPGETNSAIAVLELVDEQNEPELLAAMATTFVESGMIPHAASLRPYLRRYPTDLGALIAIAEIENFLGDQKLFNQAMEDIDTALEGGADRFLAWDRRVILAAVLTRGNRVEASHAQTKKFAAQANETRLRMLSSQSLHRLVALCRLHKVLLPSAEIEATAWAWLPPDSRERLR